MPEPTPPTDAELIELWKSLAPEFVNTEDEAHAHIVAFYRAASRASVTEPKPDPVRRAGVREAMAVYGPKPDPVAEEVAAQGLPEGTSLADLIGHHRANAALAATFDAMKPDPEVARLLRVIARIEEYADQVDPDNVDESPMWGTTVRAILAAASADQPATREDEWRTPEAVGIVHEVRQFFEDEEAFVDPEPYLCRCGDRWAERWGCAATYPGGYRDEPRTRVEYEADQEAGR